MEQGGGGDRVVGYGRFHPPSAAWPGGGVPRHPGRNRAGRFAAACGGCQQPGTDDQIAEVNKVLQEIGAQNIPQILVFNKIDLQECPRA